MLVFKKQKHAHVIQGKYCTRSLLYGIVCVDILLYVFVSSNNNLMYCEDSSCKEMGSTILNLPYTGAVGPGV